MLYVYKIKSNNYIMSSFTNHSIAEIAPKTRNKVFDIIARELKEQVDHVNVNIYNYVDSLIECKKIIYSTETYINGINTSLRQERRFIICIRSKIRRFTVVMNRMIRDANIARTTGNIEYISELNRINALIENNIFIMSRLEPITVNKTALIKVLESLMLKILDKLTVIKTLITSCVKDRDSYKYASELFTVSI
jgi:hypothetical protein